MKSHFENLDAKKKEVLDFTLSEQVHRFLLSLPIFSDNHPIIGGYYPLSDEANWLSLFATSSNLAFPKICDASNTMKFHQSNIDELQEEIHFGKVFKGPKNNLPEVKPEVLLIPGRAFSKSGERLGRGKGFYDKYLRNFDGLKIGVCYQWQLLDEVPTEEHDQCVDWIVTNETIAQC